MRIGTFLVTFLVSFSSFGQLVKNTSFYGSGSVPCVANPSITVQGYEEWDFYQKLNDQCGVITIHCMGEFIVQMELFNSLGQKVFTQNINKYQTQLDGNTLNRGIYFLKCFTKEGKLYQEIEFRIT